MVVNLKRWLLSAGALLGFALLGLHGAYAQMPDPVPLLLSNTGKTTSSSQALLSDGNPSLAQPFQTGSWAGGYSIDSVNLSYPAGATITGSIEYTYLVEIAEGETGGASEPNQVPGSDDGSVLHRWTISGSPESFSGPYTVSDAGYSTPKGEDRATLLPNTTYFLVFRYIDVNINGAGGVSGPEFSLTQDTGVDDDGSVGWSLPGGYLQRSASWQTSGSRLAIEIRGTSVPLPKLNITGPGNVNEGNSGDMTTMIFTVTPTSTLLSQQTVQYRIGGTAETGVENSDYTPPVILSLTFPVNSDDPQTIDITIIGDDIYEFNETIVVTLHSPDSGIELGDNAEATGTIRNDDSRPLVTITGPGNVAEGDEGEETLRRFTLMKSGLTALTANVSYTFTGSTATGSGPNADYSQTGTHVIFEPDETIKYIDVTVIGDNIAEDDEEVLVSVANQGFASVPGGFFTQSKFQIINDDEISISIDSPTIDEGDAGITELNFTVSLTSRSTQAITIDYEITGGTAVAGEDYIALPAGTLTINAYEPTGTITVQVLGDILGEGSTLKTIVVTLSNLMGGSGVQTPAFTGGAETISGTGSIRDDDERSFVVTSPEIEEGPAGEQAMLSFTVRLSPPINQEITVDYEVVGGSAAGAATAGVDFQTKSGTLTYAANATTNTVDVIVEGDGVYEANEDVTLRLSNSSGGLNIVRADWTGAIINDDDPPLLEIVQPADVTEGNAGDMTTLSFVVNKTGETEVPATVSYEFSGTATIEGDDADILHSESSLSIPASDSSGTIEIMVATDDLAEHSETLTVSLINPVDARFAGGAMSIQSTGTIIDDDTVELSIDNPSVEEGNSGTTDLVFTVSLTARSTAAVTVDYAVTGGTAVAGSSGDYETLSADTLSIDAGASFGRIIVKAIGDVIPEVHKTVIVTLTNPGGGDAGLTPPAFEGGMDSIEGTGTIRDDDPRSFVATTPSVDEGADGEMPTMSFMVSLTPAWHETLTVNYSVAGGTGETDATAGEDFTAVSGLLTFMPDETEKSVDVTLIGDDAYELHERLTLTLSNPSENVVVAQADWVGTIRNDDSKPVLTISVSNVTEGNPGDPGEPNNLRFVVTKTGETTLTATVNYILSGSATFSGSDADLDNAGSEFGLDEDRGLITIPAGQMTVNVDIPIIRDVVAEGTETVTMSLASPFRSRFPTETLLLQSRGAILDDDSIELSIDSPTVEEGDSGITFLIFRVSMGATSTELVTVDYDITGGTADEGPNGDYDTFTAGTLTIPGGDSFGTIAVRVYGDIIGETDETVLLTITNPSGGAERAAAPILFGGATSLEGVGTITNDDPRSFYVTSDGVTESSSGVTTTLSFMVHLSPPLNEEITVNYAVTGGSDEGEATAGEDFVAASGTLTYASNETAKTIDVSVTGDDVYEGDETVTLTLSGPSANVVVRKADWTSTIAEDDPAPVFTIDSPSVDEGDSGTSDLIFTVTKTGQTRRTASVSFVVADGTATGGMEADDDYIPLAGAALEFAPGVNTRTITVQVRGDDLVESDELVSITLTNAVHSTLDSSGRVVTGTIVNDDTLRFAIDSPSVIEGNSGTATMTFTVTMTDRSSQSATVEYEVLTDASHARSGTASHAADDSGDYTAAPPSGTLTFVPGASPQTQSFDVTVRGDENTEEHETIVVRLHNLPSGAEFAEGASLTEVFGTGTITNDDAPTFSVSSAGVVEGAPGEMPTLRFTVTMVPAWEQVVTVDYRVTGGTADEDATANEDFLETSGTVSFAPISAGMPGETVKTFNVTVLGDEFDEPDELVAVTLLNPSANSRIVQADWTGTIIDDDSEPVFSVDSPTVMEGLTGTADLEFRISKTGPTRRVAAVSFAVTDGTATGGNGADDDYVPLGAIRLSFEPGDMVKMITVTVRSDDLVETDETVMATLSNAMYATLDPNQTVGSGTIQNDDVLTVAIDSPIIDEGDSGTAPLEFTVTLTARSLSAVTVAYEIITDSRHARAGTATHGAGDGADYTASAPTGMLTFEANTASPYSQAISIQVQGDLDAEKDETVVARLHTLTGGAAFEGGTTPLELVGTGTIRNDDSPTFTVASEGVTEGPNGQTTTLLFTVTMTLDWDSEVTLEYMVTGGTATAGEDFTQISDTLTFAPIAGDVPGETVKTVTVTVIGDNFDESDESVTLTLSNPSANARIAQDVWLGVIFDDDAEPVLSIDSPEVLEGETGTADLVFTVTKSGSTRRESSVTFAVTDGTAVGGTGGDDDYLSLASGILTFAANERTMGITVQIRGDNIAEANETLTVTLSSATNASFAGGAAAIANTGTIVNDDYIALFIDSPSVDEGDTGTTDLIFTVSMGARSAAAVTVDYNVTGGTASAVSAPGSRDSPDYAALAAGTLSIAAGDISGSITVEVNGDTDAEYSETVVVTLSNPGGGVAGGPAPAFLGGHSSITGTGTIRNDDSPSFRVDRPEAGEGDDGTTTLIFSVTMIPVWTAEVSVYYSVTGSTATADEDFLETTGILTFAPRTGSSPGETVKTVSVSVLGDGDDEANEEITLTLSQPSANARVSQADWPGVIVDDDALPVFSIDSPTVVEGDSGTADLVFTVRKSGSTRRDSSVAFAVVDGTAVGGTSPGDDYLPLADGLLSFAAEDTQITVTLQVRGDVHAEDDETVEVVLSNSTLATIDSDSATGTGTIVDDDLLDISINSPFIDEGDTGTRDMNFTVLLGAVSSDIVSVEYRVTGGTAVPGLTEDYVAPTASSLSIPAGETSGTITIAVVGDTVGEYNETVIVTLSSPRSGSASGQIPVIAVGTGTGTIRNDDAPSFTAVSDAVTEGADGETRTLDFTVTMTPAWSSVVTVNYAISGGTAEGEATESDDFLSTSGTLTFAVAEASKTVSVMVVGDNFDEYDEAVTMTLSNPSANARVMQADWTGMIIDDDALPVVSITSPDVEEGDLGMVNLIFVIAKTGYTRRTVLVDFAVEDGTASSGMADDSDFIPVANGQMTFAPDDAAKTITVQVRGDDLSEVDETVSVTLSNAVYAVFDNGNALLKGYGTIRNDDHLHVSVDSPAVAEGEAGDLTPLVFTVSLSARSSREVEVSYHLIVTGDDAGTATFGSTQNTDYSADAIEGKLIFAPGTPSGQTRFIEITIHGDSQPETDETVVVRLHSLTGGASFSADPAVAAIFGTGRIVDDDRPTLSVSVEEVVEGDEGATSMIFLMSISQPLNESVVIGYSVTGDGTSGMATAGEDFRATSGTLSFAPSEISKAVDVAVIGDRNVEPDEMVTLRLVNESQNVLIEQESWSGVILTDDYELSVFTAEPTVTEPDSGQTETITFVISMTQVLDREVEVAYMMEGTATLNADYVNATTQSDSGTETDGRLLFPAGIALRVVRLSVNGDIIDEERETVAIRVQTLAGTLLGSAEATIELPEVASGATIEPDAVIAVEAVRTIMTGSASAATYKATVKGDRGFNVNFNWRVTRIEEETQTIQASGPGGRVAGETVVVLADSTWPDYEPGSIERNESSTEINAMLIELVRPGEMLGFEIFDLQCASGTCAVNQSAVAEYLRGQLSSNSDSTSVALAVTVEVKDSGPAVEVQRYALTSLSRAVASSIVSSLWRRVDAHRAGAAESIAMAGGRSLDTEALASGDSERIVREVAGLLGVETDQSWQSKTDRDADIIDGISGGLDDWRERVGLRNGGNLVEKSRFALSLDDRDRMRSPTFWGEGKASKFESMPVEGMSLESEASVAQVGVDWIYGKYMLGLATNRSQSSSDYLSESQGLPTERGTLKSSLNGVMPYLHWLGDSGIGIWTGAGFASGPLEIASDLGTLETDHSLGMMAIGVNRSLLRWGNADFSLKGDYILARTSVDEAPGISELKTHATRLRVALEGVVRRDFENGGFTTSHFELGAREDGGDDQEGAGADVAVDIRYSLPDSGLQVGGRANVLVVHELIGYREWGAGLDVSYVPERHGRGVQLSIEPRWNNPRTGVADSLWSGGSPGDGIESVASESGGLSTKARLGYGAGAMWDSIVATPYSEAEAGEGQRRLRFGIELRNEKAASGRLHLELYGERSLRNSGSEESRAAIAARLAF